uniref:Uncharacterized protein n=1 Tax=Oryza barthii TaxID=65489 RepID=A0A0D3FYX7_9ORYZ
MAMAEVSKVLARGRMAMAAEVSKVLERGRMAMAMAIGRISTQPCKEITLQIKLTRTASEGRIGGDHFLHLFELAFFTSGHVSLSLRCPGSDTCHV